MMCTNSQFSENVSTIYADAKNYEPNNPDMKPEISICEDQPNMHLPHTCLPSPYDYLRMVSVKNFHNKVAANPFRPASEVYYEVYEQMMEYLGLNTDDLTPEDELRKKTVLATLKEVGMATQTIYKIKRSYVQPDVRTMEEFDIEDENNFIGEENACKWAGYAVEDDPSTRILTYATNFTLQLLQASKAIYVDGTFR